MPRAALMDIKEIKDIKNFGDVRDVGRVRHTPNRGGRLWRRTLTCVVRVIGAATVGMMLAACSGSPPNPNPRAEVPLRPVPVDLPKYMGRWYVIANIPYFAERDFVGSRAEWVLRDDGKIDDHFYGRKNGFDQPERHYQFVDSVVPGSGGGHWRVRLFWPIYVSQLTLYVDPDYRYTLLGYPDKSLGWIFSREPVMDDVTYRALLARFDAMGYDTSRFRRVPQMPEQIGQAGFASPGR